MFRVSCFEFRIWRRPSWFIPFAALILSVCAPLSTQPPVWAQETPTGRITITLDGLTLTPALELKRAEHFERLQKRLPELPEDEAIAYLEAEMAFLIQTTPRYDDRLRALGIVTIVKWYYSMATANYEELRRLMDLPQPFTWTWPLDSLRKQLLDALNARLQREAPIQQAREIPYTGELLPSPASLRLCLRARNMRKIMEERLDYERTPLADAYVRWCIDKYLALQKSHTDKKVAALDAQYASQLSRARENAQRKDMDTARAMFATAQKLQPMRALAFVQKVVSEGEAGANLDFGGDDLRDGFAMLMAAAELDENELDVCIARGRLLTRAKGIHAGYLERGLENVSKNMANLEADKAADRETLFKLRAGLNERLGRKDKATADRARSGDTEANLLAALRDKDVPRAAKAFQTMLTANAWRLNDLQAAVSSEQDMADALRVVNTQGLRNVPEAVSALDKIAAHLRDCQQKSMVSLPGGKFKMGSTSDLTEGPVHEVTLSAFWMDKTEVSVGDYARFLKELDAGRFAPPDEILRSQRSFTPDSWPEQLKDKTKPVRWVNWHQASAYAAWQGKQLPTEAQWEFAARGAASRPFAWGDKPPAASLYGLAQPLSVGAQPLDKTPEGILDLGSNVAEWCRDVYAPTFYRTSPATDPVCTATGPERVVRGGSFALSKPYEFRAARRDKAPATRRDKAIGFRCVSP